nr:MAG TPA: hypothetical protein [Caudoviricetes sp.]
MEGFNVQEVLYLFLLADTCELLGCASVIGCRGVTL